MKCITSCLAVAACWCAAAALRVQVDWGASLPAPLQSRVVQLLQQVPDVDMIPSGSGNVSCLYLPDVCMILGNSPLQARVNLLPPAMAQLTANQGVYGAGRIMGVPARILAADGVGRTGADGWNRPVANFGAGRAALALMEWLGFAWLNAMQPVIVPPALQLPTVIAPGSAGGNITTTIRNRWNERMWHVHTEHPLELCSVLNGFDSGPGAVPGTPAEAEQGPSPQLPSSDAASELMALIFKPAGGVEAVLQHIAADVAQIERATAGTTPGVRGRALDAELDHAQLAAAATPSSTYYETWASMLPNVQSLLEWLLARGYTHVEWLVLRYDGWGEGYYNSAERAQRLQTMTGMVHAMGLLAGVDAPIVQIQQHAWHLCNASDPLATQEADIKSALTWFFNVGFDYLSTETGTTEFTHPSCTEMLGLINATASIAATEFTPGAGAPSQFQTQVKIHCSNGQTCPDILDPRTGQPLNFNYLPLFADTAMGALPHTVQPYAFLDAVAPVYNNVNFSYMFDDAFYLKQRMPDGSEPASGSPRKVMTFTETAYWVTSDVPVPLGLGPLYGERRSQDQADTAAREDSSGYQLDGVTYFESGWTWSYWLGNVAAARAGDAAPGSSGSAWMDSLAWVLRALAPNATAAARERAASVLDAAAYDQRATLLYGSVATLASGSPKLSNQDLLSHNACGVIGYCSGYAYMAGSDTWSDLPALFIDQAPKSGVQPDRVTPTQWATTMPASAPPRAAIARMQAVTADAMAHWAGQTRDALQALGVPADTVSGKLLADLVRSSNITALRAQFVVSIYTASDASVANATRIAALQQARAYLASAAVLVAEAEASGVYGVPTERIVGWQRGPTVYEFGYIWGVHSLYYWWRDYGLAAATVYGAGPGSGGGSMALRVSPCYLNTQNPVDVVTGSPTLNAIARTLRTLGGEANGWDALLDCVAAPETEPQFPADLDGVVA